jgi:hypothetical protein
MKHFSLLLLLLTTFCINAQNELLSDRFEFEADLNYNPNIPSPADFLEYELGEALTLYAHVEQYIKTVAELSDRVDIHTYGTTYEGRKLYRLAISSSENISNLESIRQKNLQIMDPVNNPNVDIGDAPVFMSFSYNIHGNETSSTEAAMQVIYRLAAANDAKTLEMLQEAVTIIYPCINADGRDRYVYWYKGSKRSVLGKEANDLEHYAPFPNGRTNHYWFDLNRDWIWGVHPESRGHTGEYVKWMPHLHTDYHEMGYNSNYFTMPGTTPRNKLLPDDYEALSDTIGQANIDAFNEYKVNYFTREAFDFFYPGYGSSYPSVMGAIGMLVEQGGISGGRAIETDDGYVLTLRQRVYDHYRTSIATLAKAVDQRELFINYSRNANTPSQGKSKTKTYVVKKNDSPYLSEFLAVMNRHEVEVKQLKSKVTKNAASYIDGVTDAVQFNKGDYVISTNQSKHLFIHSIMARNLAIEDSVMYDMSSWALPLAFNLDAYESEVDFGTDLADLSMWTAYPPLDMQVDSDEAYAVTINWKQRSAPKVLSKLLLKDYRVRVATEPFSKDGINYDAGTIVILIGRNLDKKMELGSDLEEIRKQSFFEYTVHKTGRMDSGLDLASNKVRPIKKPKIGMLVGPPFNTYTSGQIYFLFDQETEYPIERIRTEVLQQTAYPKFGQRYGLADLMDYDVIILPGGGSGLGQILDEENQVLWKQWIQAGGIVIATESAAEFFTKKKSQIGSVELNESEKDTSVEASTLHFKDRETYRGHKNVPGSAVNSMVDTSHPLGFGLDKELFTLKFGNVSLKPATNFHSVVRYAESPSDLLVAGYMNEENKGLLNGNTSAGFLPMGRGGIVYLLDNTQYRMFWRGPSRMMQNAAFFLQR